MSFEQRLPGALREAVRDVHPPVSLVAGGLARGRRMRRTRRRRLAVGAAALAGLLAAGGVAAGTSMVGGAGRTTRPMTSATSPSDIGLDTLKILKSLLPPGGKISEASGWGIENSVPRMHQFPVGAGLVYDDGHGGSTLGVGIRRSVQHEWVSDCRHITRFDRCTSRTLPDGSVLVVDQGYRTPYTDRSVKYWIASVIRRDMVHISVSETNEGSASAGRPLRRDPVLTPAQLAAIVTDPAWATVIARVPQTPPDQHHTGPTPTNAAFH
jgi:hypothetical protein